MHCCFAIFKAYTTYQGLQLDPLKRTNAQMSTQEHPTLEPAHRSNMGRAQKSNKDRTVFHEAIPAASCTTPGACVGSHHKALQLESNLSAIFQLFLLKSLWICVTCAFKSSLQHILAVSVATVKK